MAERWIKVKVAARQIEALDVVSLTLTALDGVQLPAFSAGAHIDLGVAPGLIRQYSLCNAPAHHNRYQIAVLRDPASRGGSVRVHEQIKVGQTIRISPPRNHFALNEKANKTLLIASGIGITPFVCMAESLAQAGDEFTMHYCARSRMHCAFHRRIQNSTWHERVALYFKDHQDEPYFDVEAILSGADPASHLYVCGSQRLIEHVLNSANQFGFPQEQLHREFFSVHTPAVMAADGGFSVRLARTGRTFQIPAHKSIAQVLQEAGVAVELSCEQGVCGTCLTPLLEGEAEHRDYFQTDVEKAANNRISLCCSRARSNLLVIDL